MAKFLFATVPITGHVVPGLPLARGLVEQGSDVAWYSTSNHRARIESTGSTFYPVRQASDFDDRNLDAAFPGRVPLDGLKKLKCDLKELFAGQMIPWFQDVQAILKEFPADVVVADSGFTGLLPMVLAPPHPKLAVYGAVPLTVTSRDTAGTASRRRGRGPGAQPTAQCPDPKLRLRRHPKGVQQAPDGGGGRAHALLLYGWRGPSE